MAREAFRRKFAASVTFRFFFCLLPLLSAGLRAAPPNRITRPVDARRTSDLAGQVHRQAQPAFDPGQVNPTTRMNLWS